MIDGADDYDAEDKITISLHPTAKGTLRVFECLGAAYSLGLWAEILRDLADEFDDAVERGETGNGGDISASLFPYDTPPAEA